MKKQILSGLILGIGILMSSDDVEAARYPDFVAIAEEGGAAVVQLLIERGPNPESPSLWDRFWHFFSPPPEVDALPTQEILVSGFLIDQQGHLITHASAIQSAQLIVVELRDRRRFTASVVGEDARREVALLRLDPPLSANLPVVQLGESRQLRLGQWVMAVGAPFGFEQTVTQGIISALSSPNREQIRLIQTDAAVNPGSEGGPLFALNGEVIGMIVPLTRADGSQNNDGYSGFSFAMPMDEIQTVIRRFLK